VLIGWQFTLAEFVGGLVVIALMTILLRLFVSPRLEELAREHAQGAAARHHHHPAGSEIPIAQRLFSREAWTEVADNFRHDWGMLWKEITAGFFLAGFIGQLGNGFFTGLFIRHSDHALRTIENVVVGPVVAVLSFVCSVGNVPLAAVLWSGGISFAGVVAFLFADLIVLPVIVAYRKYYGWAYAWRISALMFVTIVPAALIVDAIFGGLGLIPHTRPTRGDIFGSLEVDYKLATNLIAVAIFATFFWLTMRRGARDRQRAATATTS
jgi:uncharacterized membrane protein YraQ (UPF0718 family)